MHRKIRFGISIASFLLAIGGWIMDAIGIASMFGMVIPWGWIGFGATILFGGIMWWRIWELESKPKPNLQIYEVPYYDEREIHSTSKPYQVFGKPVFALVKFCNKPEIKVSEANAKKVIAEITFYDKKGNEKLSLKPDEVRFSGSPELPYRDKSEASHVYHEIELNANGYPQELTIAMKYKEDESCYGFSDRSYGFRDWRKDGYRLDDSELYVKVNLNGENTSGEWWFNLCNKGANNPLKLNVIPAPNFDKGGFRI
jgi:hypothetical protein